MKKIIKYGIGTLVGAVAGAGVTYIVTKLKNKNNDDIIDVENVEEVEEEVEGEE